MRVLALGLGALLVLGGSVAVVLADQQRELAVEQARDEVQRLQSERDAERAANLTRTERLADLRVAIAAQEDQLADTTGFLE
ncbi:hypothetical protein [uncultured Microbacterium sp.]|uniref:hypothetical protein n=1 Tax=uncultured Microbacterium sp. TaxID=191216 RepID=UPI00263958A3|nr:hypothetical protein [uncultured Microbacterium sp.]